MTCESDIGILSDLDDLFDNVEDDIYHKFCRAESLSLRGIKKRKRSLSFDLPTETESQSLINNTVNPFTDTTDPVLGSYVFGLYDFALRLHPKKAKLNNLEELKISNPTLAPPLPPAFFQYDEIHSVHAVNNYHSIDSLKHSNGSYLGNGSGNFNGKLYHDGFELSRKLNVSSNTTRMESSTKPAFKLERPYKNCNFGPIKQVDYPCEFPLYVTKSLSIGASIDDTVNVDNESSYSVEKTSSRDEYEFESESEDSCDEEPLYQEDRNRTSAKRLPSSSAFILSIDRSREDSTSTTTEQKSAIPVPSQTGEAKPVKSNANKPRPQSRSTASYTTSVVVPVAFPVTPVTVPVTIPVPVPVAVRTPASTFNIKGGGRKIITLADEEAWSMQTRFKINSVFRGIIDVIMAEANCLNCEINYKSYKGENVKIIDPEVALINEYTNPIKEISMITNNTNSKSEFISHIPKIDGVLFRQKYSRDLEGLKNSVVNITYVRNDKFDDQIPYQSDWFRYETDNNGVIDDDTKCALCPYCPDINFLVHNNGGYSGHLSNNHGILTNNYIIPEGINFGIYDMVVGKGLKRIKHEGLECPECHEAIKVRAQKGVNPLISYFTHFTKKHKNCKEGNPVKIQSHRKK